VLSVCSFVVASSWKLSIHNSCFVDSDLSRGYELALSGKARLASATVVWHRIQSRYQPGDVRKNMSNLSSIENVLPAKSGG